MAAFWHNDDPDGIFFEGEDQPDFGRSALHITKTSEIPPLYCEISGSFQVKAADRLRLVHRKWGQKMSSLTEPMAGILALITLDGSVTNETAQSAGDDIKTLLDEVPFHLLRWDSTHLCLAFEDMEGYKKLGESLLSGHVTSPGGLKVKQMEGAAFLNPPVCFLEIQVAPEMGSQIHHMLSSFISLFSGAFTYASVLESINRKQDTALISSLKSGSIPSVGLIISFSLKAQNIATEVKDVLGSSPWQPVKFPESVQDDLTFDTDYYVHAEVPLPVIGIRTAAPSSSVQLTIFAKSADSQKDIVHLYSKLLTSSPSHSKPLPSGVTSSKFPLTQRLELVVTFVPGMDVVNFGSLSLNCIVGDTGHLEGAEQSSDACWERKDVDGNRVLQLKMLE